MKVLKSVEDLRELGIIPLTGEADNLGLRVLCDLTQEGLKVMRETYGAIQFAKNWNHSQGQVASCMIAYHEWQSPAIVGYCLAGKTVIRTTKAICVLGAGDVFTVEPYTINEAAWPVRELGEIIRVYHTDAGQPRAGTRNIHLFSGRDT